MAEQLSLFESENIRIEVLERIKADTEQFLIENGYKAGDVTFLHSKAEKGSDKKCSFIIGSTDEMYPTNIIKFAEYNYGMSDNIRISLRTNILSEIPAPEQAFNIKKNNSADMYSQLDFKEEDSEIVYSFLMSVIKYQIEYFEPTNRFGCCGFYRKCSDQKHCVHENKLYAKACYYGKHVRAGNIFL